MTKHKKRKRHQSDLKKEKVVSKRSKNESESTAAAFMNTAKSIKSSQTNHRKGPSYPLPFPSNLKIPHTGDFLRNIPPYEEAFRQALDTSYEGFAVDYNNIDDNNDDTTTKTGSKNFSSSTFQHQDIQSALQIMEQHGLFRTDVTQPFGLGTKLAKTYVTRCLLGDEGTTYKYLGLRMFSHPWNAVSTKKKEKISKNEDLSLRDAVQCIYRLNDTLTHRTQFHLQELQKKRSLRVPPGIVNGRAKFDVTLINRMTYSSDLKSLPGNNQGKYSVSWHADSSLENYSTIAVYTLVLDQMDPERISTTKNQSKENTIPSSQKWSIALRVAHDSEGPTSSKKRVTDIESSVVQATPAIAISLPSQSAYYLLDDFNHHHQHAVLVDNKDKGSGIDAHSFAGVRYASTHRLLREGHNVYFILERCKNTISQFHRKSAKIWRSEQLLLYDIESEWIRQFYIQGSGHKENLWYAWEDFICQLLLYWSQLEKRTKQVVDLLILASQARCQNQSVDFSRLDRKEKKAMEKKKKALASVEELMIRGGGDGSRGNGSGNVDQLLYEPLAILLEERAKMRGLWHQREKEGVFKGMPSEYRPLPVPFQFDQSDTDKLEITELGCSPLPGTPEKLFDLANVLRQCAKAYMTQNSKHLPLSLTVTTEENQTIQGLPIENHNPSHATKSDAHEKTSDWNGWKSIQVCLEMQEPFAGLLLDRKKTIETRAYDLPKDLMGKKIQILQSKEATGGISQLSNVMTKSEMDAAGLTMVGWCIFEKVIVYRYKSKFEKDESKHLVKSSSTYGWKEDTKCIYGWVVKKCGRYEHGNKEPKSNVNGIIRRMRSLFELESKQN